jgi:hypothetical protein
MLFRHRYSLPWLAAYWIFGGRLMSAKRHDSSSPKLEYVSPDVLEFDPANPRFASEVASKSQSEIQVYLFERPHYASELVDSLLENGFIDYEPLVVKRNGNKFIVIEGNRRLAAIKTIRQNPEKYAGRTSDLERIPVLVFPEKPDDQQKNEMRVYLGVRHLLGFRQWPPISKAQFLERESRAGGGLDRVIKEVRVAKQEVRRFLVPYRLLMMADVQLPEGEDFWVLGEALGRAGIKKFLQLEVESKTLEILSFDRRNFKLLLDYLYGPKRPKSIERDISRKTVRETRDISRLSSVLASDTASLALKNGKTLDEAELYVDTREESLKRLSKMTNSLGLLLKEIIRPTRDEESKNLQQSFRQFEVAVRVFVKKNA